MASMLRQADADGDEERDIAWSRAQVCDGDY
jgi:hypothetical protein